MAPGTQGPIGSVGGWSISFSAGKITASAQAGVDQGALQVGAQLTGDGAAVLKQIFAAINAKLPPGAAPIEAAVEGLILAALSAIQ